MNNIPEMKIGIVAVSRDCFPESLSVNRRKAVVKAYEEKYNRNDIYECPVCIVESEIDMVKALEDVKANGCNALCVYLGNFGPEISETLLAKHFDGPKMFAAAAVGTGTTGDGKCNLSLGTSGTLFISSDEFMVDDNNALHSFVHANGRFHLMGCMLSAASCNNWWMKDILKTTDFPKEQEPLIQKDCRNELGNNNVFFLPYLMGERSPHNDASARGAFIGMSMDTKREDMLQAVFEGVAYGLRDSMEVARKLGINVTNATICGGGAKSTLWRKIVANVLNINVNTVMVEEGPAYGGAILASVAAGEYNSVEEATSKIIKIKEQVSPDEILVERYNKGYEKFKKYYPALKGLFV